MASTISDTVTCMNPNHDHTTTVDRDGNEVSPAIPFTCNHCGLPAHYDYTVEQYAHDDQDAPECFLISAFCGTACV